MEWHRYAQVHVTPGCVVIVVVVVVGTLHDCLKGVNLRNILGNNKLWGEEKSLIESPCERDDDDDDEEHSDYDMEHGAVRAVAEEKKLGVLIFFFQVLIFWAQGATLVNLFIWIEV